LQLSGRAGARVCGVCKHWYLMSNLINPGSTNQHPKPQVAVPTSSANLLARNGRQHAMPASFPDFDCNEDHQLQHLPESCKGCQIDRSCPTGPAPRRLFCQASSLAHRMHFLN
jgi:hypothetical protein